MELNLSFWTIASVLIGLLVLLPSIMGFFSKNQFDVRGKTILVTGASEGMGRSVAIQLAQKGANVIITSRSVSKLELALSAVKAAATSPSQRFKYISADLCEEDAADRVLAEAMAWNNGQSLDIVWCVAGSSHPSLFIETPRKTMRWQMDVNFWSCADMAHAVLKGWLAPGAVEKGGSKHFIFTSSVAAFYPFTGYAPYTPGKAAIKALSDTLAQEVLLYGADVKIHTVFPSTIASPGLDNENLTKPEITLQLEAGDTIYPADDAAANAIKGLENGDYLVTWGFLNHALRACAWGSSRRNNWLLDTVFTWIVASLWYFIGLDMDGKVKAYGKKHGHPSTYAKKI